jgi:cell division protein FtsW
MLAAVINRIDWRLMIPVGILIVVGYIMVFSTTSFKGLSEFNDAYYFIKRHSLYLLGGVVLMVLGAVIPLKFYKKWVLWGYFMALLLALMTLLPGVGVSIGGANRWVNWFGFQFQPVEIMKFWWAIAVAFVLEKKTPKLSIVAHGMVPLFIIILIPVLVLMSQPDLGNAILTLVVAFAMLMLSKLPAIVFGFAGVCGGGLVLGSILRHPYQMDRIQSFLNPWMDPLGSNYHIIQSFTAIGSGGWFGFGIGESRLKYFYLPLHYSDFIFSILCEEGGLILGVAVLILFSAVFLRGFQIAFQQPAYSFEQYVAIALTCFLIFQAFINISVVSGLFPITGIPLTFISYGGTSLMVSMFFVGVIHRIGT